MNLVILKGNMVRDPEVRYVDANGKQVAVLDFCLAVNRVFKQKDGTKKNNVTFIECEAWDSGAETIAKYCAKGDPLLVNGSLKVEEWENQEGERRRQTRVRVSGFELLYGSKGARGQTSNATNAENTQESSAPEETAVSPAGDDIPF